MAKSLMVFNCNQERARFVAGAAADALRMHGLRVAVFVPIAQCQEGICAASLSEEEAIALASEGKYAQLVSAIIDRHDALLKEADIVVTTCVAFENRLVTFAERLSIDLAHDLDSCVLSAICPEEQTEETLVAQSLLSVKLFAQEGLDVFGIVSMFAPSAIKTLKDHGMRALDIWSMNVHPEDIRTSSRRMTPAKFLRILCARARDNKRTIVLPEGDLDRVLRAAAELRAHDLVNLVLLGKEDEVRAKASGLGVSLDAGVRIVDPSQDANFDTYATTLYDIRKSKGMTLEAARQLMQDRTYFGTMMVHQGHADGMVSGATTTTAETIRPALQFIKTKPGIKTVSGVMLMCLSDRVYIYGDCAVIPNPTTEQLCDVAVASASTAKAFGIEPRVAMLSYSTGASGTGPDVEAVKAATDRVREQAPGLLVEGPIQYDAAVDADVAATKLPGSPVAGKATVFVFPTLNAGNIGYKAVQRSSNAIAIGPILQGLNKPVNDLSRGATVTDIVNTVVVTALQAQHEA